MPGLSQADANFTEACAALGKTRDLVLTEFKSLFCKHQIPNGFSLHLSHRHNQHGAH